MFTYQAEEGDWDGLFHSRGDDYIPDSIPSINTLEAQFARLVMTEIQTMMKQYRNKGSGSSTLPVTAVHVKMLERWSGWDFEYVDDPDGESKKGRKRTFQPRDDLTFEKVTSCFVFSRILFSVSFRLRTYLTSRLSRYLPTAPSNSFLGPTSRWGAM